MWKSPFRRIRFPISLGRLGSLSGRQAIALALVVVVVLVGFLPIVGCPLRLSRPGVTITLWDAPRWPDESGNRYHWMQRKIAEFEAQHPLAEVILVPVEWSSLRAMLNSAKEAGQFPDIAPLDISAGGITLAEVEAGLLEPVDNFIAKRKDISPQALAAYTYGDQLWGFPSSMTGHSLLLNLDLFAERGVPVPVNGKWTWEEFRSACRKLTFDRDKDGETDVYGFGTYILPGYYEAWPFLYLDGARPLSDDLTQYTLGSPQGVSALKKLTDLIYVDKAAHPSTGSSAVRGLFDLFGKKDKQEIAIEPWSAWAIDYLKTQEGMITNVGVAEYPSGAGGASVSVGGTGGFVVFRQDDAYRRSQIVALANYLTSAASQYELARGARVFPARRQALELEPFADDPLYARAAEIAFNAESLPRHPAWPDIERAIQREVQMALLGIKSPEEALADAGVAVEKLLAAAAAKP